MKGIGWLLAIGLLTLLFASSIEPEYKEGNRVTLNPEAIGFFSPDCSGEKAYVSFDPPTISRFCKTLAVPDQSGIIEKGGDYDAFFRNGCYRVRFNDGTVLWIPSNFIGRDQ